MLTNDKKDLHCGQCNKEVEHNFIGYYTYNERDLNGLNQDRTGTKYKCSKCNRIKKLDVLGNERGFEDEEVENIENSPLMTNKIIGNVFKEAILVHQISIRCANFLLRLCTEITCDYIADKHLSDKTNYNKMKMLGNKIGFLQNNCVHINGDFFDCIKKLKDLGNDYAHLNKVFGQLDGEEAFDAMKTFLENVWTHIKIIEEVKQKMP